MKLSALSVIASLALSALSQQISLPLKTDSRWILDNAGNRVKLRCINWPGHMETNIPEGLDKQSIDYIADFIQQQGFNCVRLTYSIDHALNPEVSVQDSFIAAALAANIPVETFDATYARVVEKNPFVANATTQDVFGAVIKSLWDRNVMTILDNHVSKAGWCCDLDDGNGWWDKAQGYVESNSRYFNTGNWLNGLSAMATWATSQPGVVAMSLRNEPRPFPVLQDFLDGHSGWLNFMQQGGERVHEANPDVLVLVGGTQSTQDLTVTKTRNLDYSAWAGKHVWEMHAYEFSVTYSAAGDNCDIRQDLYGAFVGFVLEQGQEFTAPLIMSEWGMALSGGPNDGLTDDGKNYYDCVKEYMLGNDMDWALWGIQGSYYVREGTADAEETWGLMDKEWSGLRNEQIYTSMADLFTVTQGP
ncbi:cellulase family protein [Truncatella angustata]|uniref:Cellulase family protein n=1 Tax=Truncatella angustata TaxID=152316 RepID=A0A9P8ULJ8_9PEZI|nr:cellulase family protein [Truncatella angustata]KAH6654339.1 cellulase family protein [Truncatella angustata]